MNKNRKSYLRPAYCEAILLFPLGLLAAPSAATAQAAPAPEQIGVQDIIVTATRKEESAQSVPIALTAISASSLEKRGVTSALQLPQLAPSMYVLGAISEGSPRYSLRGISNSDTFPGALSAIASYVDDVFQASQFGVATALFDLQRVEVLRGPQGTTFGKNTTGGAVAYFSQVPTNRFEGYVTGRLAAGDRSQKYVQGAINAPIVDDVLAARFSFNAERRGSYVNDPTNPREEGDSRSHAGRLQLRWTPSSETTVNLTGFYSKLVSDGALSRGQYSAGNTFGLPPYSAGTDDISLTPLNGLKDNFVNKGGTLRIEQALGDFALTSITHYRHTVVNKALDVDGRVEDVFSYASDSTASQYGQEVRLTSDSTKPLSGLLGGYFEKDKLHDVAGIGATTATALFGQFNNHSNTTTRTTSYAVFGNLKLRVNDRIALTGGIRKSFEKRKQDALLDYFVDRNFDWTEQNLAYRGPAPITPSQSLPYRLDRKSNPLTWDVTLNYNPKSDVLLFARVAKGSRSGGFNQGGVAIFPGQIQTVPLSFGPESIQSYELGVKSTLLDRLLRINATVFHYDFNNQQVVVPGPGSIPITDTAGKAKVDGGEIEIIATPIRQLELALNGSYTDPRYTRYLSPTGDFSGNRLVQAPKWTVNGSANWTAPITDGLDFQANTFWSYRSDLFFTPNNDVAFRAKPVTIGNFRVGLRQSGDKGVSVNAFVNNVTNKKPLAGGTTFGPGTNVVYYEAGRLYGVDLSFKW